MTKVVISLKELEMIKYTVISRFHFSTDDIMTLTIKELTGYLQRKGVMIEIELEEETDYE